MINFFFWLFRVNTSKIVGNIFRCLYKPSSRVSAIKAIFSELSNFELIETSFENFAFFSNPIDITESNGLIGIIGAGSYSWDASYFVSAKFYNNQFINMESTVLDGVVGFLNVHDIVVFNNTFVNCTAKRGGGLSILFSQRAYISNTRLFNCFSQADGGAAIFQEVGKLELSSLVFINCHSGTEGGAVKVEGVSLGDIFEVFGENTSSVLRGGFFAIRESANFTLMNLILKASRAMFGGGFFIENLNSNFINMSTIGTSADSGGFIFISGSSSKVILEGVKATKSTSELDGAALRSINIALLKQMFFDTEACSSKE
jgi:hypothetical protein